MSHLQKDQLYCRLGQAKLSEQQIRANRGVPLRDLNIDELCKTAGTKTVLLRLERSPTQMFPITLENPSLIDDLKHNGAHDFSLVDDLALGPLAVCDVVQLNYTVRRTLRGSDRPVKHAYPGLNYEFASVVGVQAPTFFFTRYFPVEPLREHKSTQPL